MDEGKVVSADGSIMGKPIQCLKDLKKANTSAGTAPSSSTQIQSGEVFLDDDIHCKYAPGTKKGLCFIFNQMKFDENTKTEPRPESIEDEKAVTDLFKTMGYEVVPYQDRTKKEISNILNKKRNFDEYGSLIIFMFSHGGDNQVWARDAPLDIKDLVSPFTDEKCSSLCGKPKLFFIQACGGNKHDSQPPVTQCADNYDVLKVIVEPNCLMSYASPPGYAAYKKEKYGSFFIQNLCRVFRENYTQEDVLSMLTRVHGLVAANYWIGVDDKDKITYYFMQIPSFVSQLTRKFFFNF